MYSCDWCGEQCYRVWEIPNKPSKDYGNAWVCKECHTGYFDGDLDRPQERNERTI